MKLKKLLCGIIAVAMVLGTMSLPAFAEIDVPEGDLIVAAAVQKTVSSMAELADAIRNAEDGDIIKLAAGTYTVTAKEQMQIKKDNLIIEGAGKETVIELAGYTCSGQAGILVTGNNVTLKNFTVNGNGKDDLDGIKFTQMSGSWLEGATVENVTVTAKKNGINMHHVNHGVIKGCDITASGLNAAVSVANADVSIENTVCNAFLSVCGRYGKNSSDYPNPSLVTIVGTENNFKGLIMFEDAEKAGTVVSDDVAICYEGKGTAVIGEPEDPSSYMAVVERAGKPNLYFKNGLLNQAIEAAQDGDTIELLNDIALDSNIALEKSLKIVGNSHTINFYTNQANANESTRVSVAGGNTLTFENAILTGSYAQDIVAPFIGVRDDAKLVLNNCEIKVTSDGAASGFGIINTMGANANSKVTMTDCKVTNLRNASEPVIYVIGGAGASELDITDNEFYLGSWMMFNMNAAGKIENNVFHSGTAVNATGLNGLKISGNTFKESMSGTRFVIGGDYEVTNNIFENLGDDLAINVWNGTSKSGAAVISGNTFNLTDESYGIRFFSKSEWGAQGGNASDVKIEKNAFLGNGVYHIRNNDGWSGAVVADKNYFGENPDFSKLIWSDKAIVYPYYTDEAMTTLSNGVDSTMSEEEIVDVIEKTAITEETKETVAKQIEQLSTEAQKTISVEKVAEIVAPDTDEGAFTMDDAFAVTVAHVADEEDVDHAVLIGDNKTVYEITAVKNDTEPVDTIPTPALVKIASAKEVSEVLHYHDGAIESLPFVYKDGFVMFTMNEFSQIALVTKADVAAGQAKLQLVPVANTNNKFEILLTAPGTTFDESVIKNFVAGEFTATLTGDALDYTLDNCLNNEASVYFDVNEDGSRRYHLNLNKFDENSCTTYQAFSQYNGEYALNLGTITIEGYGKGAIQISDVLMQKHDGSAENLRADIDTVVVNEAVFDITVPTHTLTVQVEFPNNILDNDYNYQSMKAVITGPNLKIEKAFGLNGNAVLKENAYSFTADLMEGGTYTVTISGEGYRTARYTVVMTEDKTLTFWNNVKDEATVIETGKDASKANVTFLAGDIVRDGEINLYDLSAVVSYFGTVNLSETNHPEYAKYDLNRDGKIDSKDVAMVLVSWGN